MAINNQPTIEPRTVTGIFTKYIAKTIPLAFDESMSYYECLCALLKYLNDTIVPDINNVNDGLGELQTFYNELQTYVNTYFDNLDVQEEINNKLDEMAESGQLTDIIAQYLGLAGMIAFDTVADMKLAENLVNGSKCRTLGYHSVNDGGGAYYKIRTVTNDDVVDEMTIIEVHDNLLVAELVIDNEINILQLGAKKDDSTYNSYNVLNKAFNMDNTPVYIPYGTYYIDSTLTATKAKRIYGKGVLIFRNATGNGLVVGDSIQLDGLEINCNGNFSETLLKYDGEIGERSYPSSASFSNLVISSNTENQIDCFFDFKPYRNYGININNVNIGKSEEIRKADYGFKMDTSEWVNGVNIDTLIIDIFGTAITPFYLSNSNVTCNNWNVQNLFIQSRNANYTNYAYFHNFQRLTLINPHIYDLGVGTITSGDEVQYDYCAYITVEGEGSFRLTEAKITNDVSVINSNENYRSYFNGTSYNSLYQKFSLSSYSNKIIPLFFPMYKEQLNNRNIIEIMYRYGGGNSGTLFRCLSNSNGTNTTWYNRNVYLEANKYKSTPVIHSIENVNEGTIVWVKGGIEMYYYCECWKKPEIAINKTVTEIGTSNTKVLSAIDITESTTWLPATTNPLFYWGQKIINASTFNTGE